MKRCTICGKEKPPGAFAPRFDTKSGRRKDCRSCKASSQAAWRIANLERVQAHDAEKYAANREKVDARAAAWVKAHPEQTKARIAAWRKANPDKVLAAVQRRRALKLNAFVEHVDPASIWERDRGVCGICGGNADPADWHLDHVIPLAAGGTHEAANVQVSHPSCNMSKGAKVEVQAVGA